jgi:hypothetical protein
VDVAGLVDEFFGVAIQARGREINQIRVQAGRAKIYPFAE